jgi:glycosyltransferase involved in cell wall biosynthesis
MSKKNLLFITPRFPPAPGGAETYAGDLVFHLKDFGWNTYVICDKFFVKKNIKLANFHSKQNVKFIKIPKKELANTNLVKWRIYQFGLLVELEKVISSLPTIDLIHANSIESAVLARIIADHLNVPLVATIHEHAPESLPFGKGRCRLAFERLDIDALIAPSNFYYNRALKWNFPKDKLHLVTHGVSKERLKFTKKIQFKLEWGGKEFLYIVLIGRIYEPKGILVLIEAAKLLKNLPQIKFIIVGPDGPGYYSREVRKKISDYGLDYSVKLIGEVDPILVPDIIRSSDIIVAPSLAEGFGLTVVEAMFIGKPIVASKIGGLSEIITNNKNGLHVSAGDFLDLADKIEMLVSDELLRNKLSNNAKIYAQKNFSAIRMAKHTSNIYKQLL